MSDSSPKASGDSPLAAKTVSSTPDTKADETNIAPAQKVAAALRSITPASVARTDPRINPLLDQLVYGDNDLVGLVAYALHEVNRRDWRNAYEAAHGRPPNEAEFSAYLVGEQLERRLETYRRLAEDAIAKVATGDTNLRRLAEAGADVARILPATATEMRSAPTPGSRAFVATANDKAVVPPKKSGEMGKLAIYLLFLLIAVAGLAYLLRYGMDVTPGR